MSGVILPALFTVWPFHPVPSRTRGVIAAFDKIVGIENEDLMVLPLGKITLFRVRIEHADVAKTKDSTSNTQPAKDGMTMRNVRSPLRRPNHYKSKTPHRRKTGVCWNWAASTSTW